MASNKLNFDLKGNSAIGRNSKWNKTSFMMNCFTIIYPFIIYSNFAYIFKVINKNIFKEYLDILWINSDKTNDSWWLICWFYLFINFQLRLLYLWICFFFNSSEFACVLKERLIIYMCMGVGKVGLTKLEPSPLR